MLYRCARVGQDDSHQAAISKASDLVAVQSPEHGQRPRSKWTAAGAKEYQILLDESNKLVDAYSAKWNIPRATLDAQLPALIVLEKMNHPVSGPAGKAPGIAIGALVLGLILPLLGGTFVGFWHVSYTFIVRHFGG